MNQQIFSYASRVITDHQQVIEDIKEHKNLKQYFIRNNLVILVCTLIYGAVLGAYVGGYQILINAIKIPLLFFVTLYISLPIFYILNLFAGSKIDLYQTSVLLITGYVIASIIMIAFTPFVLFFILTARDYYFISSLTIGISGLSGFLSIIYIFRNFSLFHETKKWYPSFIVGSFAIALVGTQLAWTLRPFYHSYDRFIRPVQGNFYVAMVELFSQEPYIVGFLLFIFGFMALLIAIIMYNRTRPEVPNKIPQVPQWGTDLYRSGYPGYPYYPQPNQQIQKNVVKEIPKKEERGEAVPITSSKVEEEGEGSHKTEG